MAVKTKVSLDEMKNIFRDYNLDSPERLYIFSEGAVNSNYKVETATNTYVFRIYENRSKTHINFEQEALDLLKSIESIPTAHVISQKNGHNVGQYSGKYFAVFDFLEGSHKKEYQIKKYCRYTSQIVKTIAKLNRETEGHCFIREHSVERCCPEDCWETAKNNAKNISDPKVKKERLTWIKQQLDSIFLPDTLPKSLCHRDPNLNNVLFSGKELTGLIDFDMASYSHSICDLGSLIYWLAWNEEKCINFDITKKIISDYNTERSLNTLEKKHIFDGLKMVLMMGAGWYIGSKEGFQDKTKVEYLNNIGRNNFIKKLICPEKLLDIVIDAC